MRFLFGAVYGSTILAIVYSTDWPEWAYVLLIALTYCVAEDIAHKIAPG